MKKIIYILILFAFQLKAAVFTVTNTNDSGTGSFRQAILDANSTTGLDMIDFNISGVGPHTIQPLTNLPVISDLLTINGYSQPGSSVNTLTSGNNANIQIVLDGSLLMPQATGLQIHASNSIISGISIVSFQSAGISLSSDTSAQTELISVSGNFIGLMPDGNTVGPNGTGVIISSLSRRTLIGGSDVSEKNIISGNSGDGILIESDFNSVLGNLIGTDSSGQFSRGNFNGVSIFPPLGNVNADSNLIGSNLPQESNLISGNNQNGIDINGVFTAFGINNTQVVNNIIGLNVSGSGSLGNANTGISVRDGVNTIIRENEVGGNVNGLILSSLTRGTDIQNNVIGGSAANGNTSDGIRIVSGSGPNFIGHPFTGVGNTISFNSRNGVSIDRTDTQENRIMFNTIFNNGSLGIDLTELGAIGVSPNDADDSDFGPNNLLNFPIFLSAQDSNGMIQVNGDYDGLANETIILEYFYNQQCDPSGHGEGEVIAGHDIIVTDNQGHADIQFSMNPAPSGFNFISSLATDTAGNTSEFSPCIMVTGGVMTYDLGVDVSGLAAGNSMQLQNNLADTMIVNTNGISIFPNMVPDGSNYSVTVSNQPLNPPQVCTVSNSTGVISGSDVILNVNCVNVPIASEPAVIPAISFSNLILMALLISSIGIVILLREKTDE